MTNAHTHTASAPISRWDETQVRALSGPLRSRRRWIGVRAVEQLQCSLDLAAPLVPQALYVHVPFCAKRCPFCDLHCFAAKSKTRDDDLNAYVCAVEREIAWYAGREGVRRRPVTTLHWGGGTPMTLGARRLVSLLGTFRSRFCFSEGTEVAIEARISELTDEHLALFAAERIRRVHAGVQTLDDPLRRSLGRRGGRAFVLERLSAALTSGAVVSVDLLFGLPGQTGASLRKNLAALCSLGVHGFALYELHKTDRNRKLFEQTWEFEPDRAANARLAEEGASFLLERGYVRCFFNHFSRPADDNRYATHPARREESLAFGPWADGAAAGLGWRNHGCRDWLHAVDVSGCGAEEVSLYLPEEKLLLDVESALMNCRVTGDLVCRFAAAAGADGESLIATWLAHGLAREHDGILALTEKGIWLHGNMIAHLRGLLPE